MPCKKYDSLVPTSLSTDCCSSQHRSFCTVPNTLNTAGKKKVGSLRDPPAHTPPFEQQWAAGQEFCERGVAFTITRLATQCRPSWIRHLWGLSLPILHTFLCSNVRTRMNLCYKIVTWASIWTCQHFCSQSPWVYPGGLLSWDAWQHGEIGGMITSQTIVAYN